MELLRSHPGITSAVGGILFAVLVVVFGGGGISPIKVVLAVFLGIVFGASMYAASRRRRA